MIWPSVWPLDHDDEIAALTAALSLMTPFGEGCDEAGSSPLEPTVEIGRGLLAGHGMECGNNLPCLDEQGNVFLDRSDSDGLRFRKRIAANGQKPR